MRSLPRVEVGLGDGGRIECPARVRYDHRDVLMSDRCGESVDTGLVGIGS